MFNNLKKLKLGEILQDSKNFIQVNKKTLSIIAASAVVVAGTYYLYKKKGKISSQKQKNIKDEERQSTDVSDDSGFILEEDSKSSFSNLDCLKCSHYDIILNFNSDANIIQTSVKYSFVVQKETNEILLDMDQQEIIICVLDGFSKKFEIKELSREQEDGDKLGVRDINYEAQNSQRQLRIEIERQLEVGERFELTINSITRQIIHPSVKLINNSAEPQNKIFVSTGKGNYSIFPCQNYPSAIATFDITISTKQPQILQKENKKQNAQYKGITSGQYIASYQYSNENYVQYLDLL